MKRKDFLKTGAVALLPLAINGWPVTALGNQRLFHLLSQNMSSTGRVLVLIQLNGGNDGLNTLIPMDQYARLSAARSQVLIPENRILRLSGHDQVGFHPAMSRMREMFDDGYLSIVQDAGYPEPDFSHFRSTDIWMSGSSGNTYLTSGWLGRMLEEKYPDFPNGYPNAQMPDPPAIQIGFGGALALLGQQGNTGMAVSDPDYIYRMLSGVTESAPNTPAGHELTYIRRVAQQTEAYSVSVKNAAEKAQNLSPLYPTGNALAEQLKLVARLIGGGLKTPVYMVSINGFDTHASQVETSDKTKGVHANLLQNLSEAIYAFQDDCNKLGIADRVTGMTFSEFGRRIVANGSMGTDHGTASPQFVFGRQVNPGIIGHNPIIPERAQVFDNLPMQYDYRQIYSTILSDWFQLKQHTIKDSLLFEDFDNLPIFNAHVSTDKIQKGNAIVLHHYPNPFHHKVTFQFDSPGGVCELRIYDSIGRHVLTPYHNNTTAGTITIPVNTTALPPGRYYGQLITPKGRTTSQMNK
jgi:uncharacterized protein (DUF1501 family)